MRIKTFWLTGLALAGACSSEETPTGPVAVEPPVLPSLLTTAPNSWTAKAPLPSGRGGFSIGVANNPLKQPILYVFGGSIDDLQYHDVWAYSLVTNSWTYKGEGFEGSVSNGVGNVGGKLYISGGFNHSGGTFVAQRTLMVYDPVANTWTQKADMPRSTAAGITGVISGKLYVLAGACGDDCVDETIRRLYRYDPTTNAWATLSWCPHFHRSGGGGVINGKFYVAGNNWTANLDVYDPATNKWKALAPLPVAIGGAAGVVANGKLFVITGFRAVYAYDPVTNSWKSKAAYPAKTGPAAAGRMTLDGKSYILGVKGILGDGVDTLSTSALYTP
jgi:N-acetylneuraminic acid mutarotase